MSFNPVLIVSKAEKPEWYKSTAPFSRPENRTAIRQLLTTVIPYLLLMALMVQAVRHGHPYGITLTLAVLATPSRQGRGDLIGGFNLSFVVNQVY